MMSYNLFKVVRTSFLCDIIKKPSLPIFKMSYIISFHCRLIVYKTHRIKTKVIHLKTIVLLIGHGTMNCFIIVKYWLTNIYMYYYLIILFKFSVLTMLFSLRKLKKITSFKIIL